MAVFSGPEIPNNGLVLHLDAANTRSYPGSGTTWTDLSGNGNNGTLTNGPVYSTINNGSMIFDGSNDYCVFSNSFADLEQSSFTIETIFKTSATGIRLIFGKYAGTGADYWFGTTNAGYLNWSFGSPSKVDITSIAVVNDGVYKITHAVYNKTNANTYLYVNGILQTTGTVPSTITSAAGNLTIGTFGSSGGFYYPGALSLFKIYNRALSAAEIQQNFEATRGRYGI